MAGLELFMQTTDKNSIVEMYTCDGINTWLLSDLVIDCSQETGWLIRCLDKKPGLFLALQYLLNLLCQASREKNIWQHKACFTANFKPPWWSWTNHKLSILLASPNREALYSILNCIKIVAWRVIILAIGASWPIRNSELTVSASECRPGSG